MLKTRKSVCQWDMKNFKIYSRYNNIKKSRYIFRVLLNYLSCFFLLRYFTYKQDKNIDYKYLVHSLCQHVLFLFWTMHFSLSQPFPQSVNKPKDWYRSMFRQIHKKPEGMCSPPKSLSETMRKFLSIIVCHILHWSRKNKAEFWLRNFRPHYLNIV